MPNCGFVTQIRRKLRPDSSSGLRDTFVATAVKGKVITLPVYFKIFSTIDYKIGSFNELFGYDLAKACHLPVPPDTFLCACKKDKLKSNIDDLDDRFPESDYISGVASVDGNPHGFKQILEDGPILDADLLNWRHVAHVAVFDELLYNTDRNMKNLIRVSEHEYIIIDHEQIFGGTIWNIDELESLFERPSMSNSLAAVIGRAHDDVMKRRMIKIAQEDIGSIRFSTDMLRKSISSFAGLSSSEVQHIINMINKRAKKLPEFMNEYLKYGQIFNEHS